MSESLRKKLLYGVLVLAIAWGAYNFDFGGKERMGDAVPQATAEISRPAVTDAREQIDVAEYLERSWGPDPFRTEAQTVRRAKESRPTWELSGIVYHPSRPLAVINKKTVTVGDTVDRATVVGIDRREVTIRFEGRNVTLRVTTKG